MEKGIQRIQGFQGRLCCLLLVTFLLLAMFVPGESYAASSFKDIKGHWAERYIETAVAQGIIKGYPDGSFLPDEKVSRAEFISMLNRALGNTSLGSSRFGDVSVGAWYYNDVAKAVTAGFVNGFGDGSFRPNYKITRQEAAVMLSGIVPTFGYSANLNKHSDYRTVADWANTAMSKVSGKGYISGYTDGKLHPLDSLTRAQAAKIISDIIVKETIVTTDPVVKKDGTKLTGRIYSNNVTIHKDLGDGSATIDNCVILGKLIVQGGGDDTVTVNNSRIADATVDRSGDVVRLLAKGETAIANTTCSRGFILQTSALSGGNFGTGFEKVSVTSSASGSLQGSFPYVSIDGSSAKLQLLSGTVATLDVNSAGRKSEITADSKATISQANVYAESYFRGTGTISDMQVYAKGVTYETKPKKVTVRSGGETPNLEDPGLTMTFDPKQGETGVYLDTKITITFNSAMRERDGSSITNAEIQDIVTIRRGSSTGSIVDYSGTINSARTVMTLTPSSLLDSKTKYYIVVKSGTMINADGDRNDAETASFTTGSSTEKLVVTYSPANGEKDVSVSKISFTITFSEAVKRYSGSSAVNDSYLSDVITFQGGNIKASNYYASINSAKTKITITLENNYSLALNTKYTIGIRSSTLKTGDGTNVPSSSVSWTTAGTPALSSVSTVPYELSVDLKVTPNVSGNIYAVLVSSNASAPSASQIRDGKDKEGKAAIAAISAKATAGSASTLKLSGENIKSDTPYKVYVVLYDGNGNTSSVVESAARTTLLKLKSLSIIPDPGTSNVLKGFESNTFQYEVIVPNGTDSVRVVADPNVSDFNGDITIKRNDQTSPTNTISLTGKETIIAVIIQESGKSPVTYTVKVREKGTAELDYMTINNTPYEPGTAEKYELIAEQVKVSLFIKPVESDAKIKIKADTYRSEEIIERTLGPETTELVFTIVSSDGVTEEEYTIKFDRVPVTNIDTDPKESDE